MKRILGLVLAKETGVGIPNLVVAVFDSDLTLDDLRRQELSPDLLKRAGKRICSVLTDATGRFSIPAEDLEFAGNESRPDLLLIVLAPEDVQSPKRPYPLPADERTLYMSTVPRFDAGAEEAYVIRLLQAQLDHHSIATGSMDRNRHVRALAEAADSIKRLRAQQKLHNQEAYDNRKRYAEIAAKKMGRLTAVSPLLRSAQARTAALLIEHKSDLVENLSALQEKANEEGLAALRKQKSTLKLRLSEADLDELGLKTVKGRLIGKISAIKVAAKVRSLMGGVDLIRVRGAENPSVEELDRKYPAPAPEVDHAE